VCLVCECFVILNPYIYLAVGAAPQRTRGAKVAAGVWRRLLREAAPGAGGGGVA